MSETQDGETAKKDVNRRGYVMEGREDREDREDYGRWVPAGEAILSSFSRLTTYAFELKS